MASIDTSSTGNAATSALDGLYSPNEAARVASQKSLGQEDFLKLLTTQMQNQDPTNPVDNTKMIADMAQFSSLQAMQDLNESVSSITQMLKMSQAVQASSLVGHDIVANGTNITLETGKSPVALLNLEDPLTEVKAQIRNGSGLIVKEFSFAEMSSGKNDLAWDGKDDAGNVLPAGQYSITAWGSNAEGARASIGTMVANKVISVDLATSGATLNLADGSQTSLDDVQQIR